MDDKIFSALYLFLVSVLTIINLNKKDIQLIL